MEDSRAIPIGLSLIAVSIITQIVSCILMCCLVRKRQGGQTVVMRICLFISSAFDQTATLIYHLQHHYSILPYSGTRLCIILRMVMSFVATFTVMWMVTVSVVYLTSTLNSANRVFINSRFLSHCVTWSWSLIGCAMYGVVTFLTENGGKSYLCEKCWGNIGDTVHLYFTHGYGVIALIALILVTITTRYRISSRRHLTFKPTRPSRRQQELYLQYDVNVLLCLSVFLCFYYSSLFARLTLYDSGSDLVIMVIQSVKGFLIAVCMCYLNKYVIALIKCNLPTSPREYHSRRSHGSLVSNSSLRTTRSSNTSKFVFD